MTGEEVELRSTDSREPALSLPKGRLSLHRQFGKLELRRYFEDRSGTESAAYLAGAVEVTG